MTSIHPQFAINRSITTSVRSGDSGVLSTVKRCFIVEVIVSAAHFALDRTVCDVHRRVSIRRSAIIAYHIEILRFGNIAISVTEATKRLRL